MMLKRDAVRVNIMKSNYKPARILLTLGMLMFALIPSGASAHDNLGGDELAMSSAMLIGAIIVTAMALVAGIWAWQAGQFTNMEESKFRMLAISDDFDEVMAEVERAEAGENAANKGPKSGMRVSSPALDGVPVPSGRADHTANA